MSDQIKPTEEIESSPSENNPPKKNYEVFLKATCVVVVVGAENEDDAEDIAEAEMSRGSFKVDECNVTEIPDDELESAKRYANEVAEGQQ